MSGSIQQIYLGLTEKQKQSAVQSAAERLEDVDRVYVFHGGPAPEISVNGLETVFVPWRETEMYRTFYPLLGQPYSGRDIPAITDRSLCVVDEMLVTRKRTDLKYNCMHHFLRVTERRIVFSYLPFIEDEQDFMILLDYAYPDRYKMQPYQPGMSSGILGTRRVPEIASRPVATTAKDTEAYEKKRNHLFDTLGQKDPDTIPRTLILQAGRIKARDIREGLWYVARNSRVRRGNVVTYADSVPGPDVQILDPTYKRRDLIEFIRRNGLELLVYMQTDLPVDRVYLNDYIDWVNRLSEFYEQTNLH